MRGSVSFWKKQTVAVHERIAELCKEGDALASSGRPEDAKQKYIAALKLLPREPHQWEAATWIYVALGDVHLRSQHFGNSHRIVQSGAQLCDKP
jgi:hypothetical protein